jgi:hypothetical protein
MVFLDTSLHVEAVTDSSKLPWHKYRKRQNSKNSHPYNPSASLAPALDNMKVVTDLWQDDVHIWLDDLRNEDDK